MNRDALLDWARTAARLFCGAVLVYASSDKIGDAAGFIHYVTGYLIIPKNLIPLAAAVLPWLEFLTGAGLMLGLRWRGALLVYCGLMVVYMIGLSVNLSLGVPIDCGCFPGETEKATWLTVLRDFALLVPGAFALASNRTRAALDTLLERIRK
jgi:uncharacterized membrane protein YphA (DoxX/SURF4 family)